MVEAVTGSRDDVYVSVISVYELATKFRIGKLPSVAPLLPVIDGWLVRQGFELLDISFAHARLAGALPIPHKDPWARMLIAQAQCEGLTLVSNEAKFDAFGVKRLW